MRCKSVFVRPAWLIALLLAPPCGRAAAEDPKSDPLDVRDIRIRDPFILTDVPNGRYLMIANMGNRRPGAKGWECYTGKDLKHWQGPVTVFLPPQGF